MTHEPDEIRGSYLNGVAAERERCIAEIRRVQKRNIATRVDMQMMKVWNDAVRTMANECIDAIENPPAPAHTE